MAFPYRLAVCNELFQKVPLSETCRQVRELGYEGWRLRRSPYQMILQR
jgi:hypothetical protein